MANANNTNLTDDELRQVTGGMSCQDGVNAAKIYANVASFYGAIGNSSKQAEYAGRALGVMQGACT
jgi:hypothetical protein